MTADSGGYPCRVGQHGSKLGAKKIEDRAARRHRIGNTEHELNMWSLLDEPFLHQVCSVVQHRKVEYLDLRLDTVIKHRACETFDELRCVLVNTVWKVDRACRQRRHVGLQVKHCAALLLFAAAPASGELHDHAGAMLAHAFLHAAVQLRV